MKKKSSRARKKKPRALFPPWCRSFVANACAACGEWTKLKRKGKWCCLSCRRLTAEMFEGACQEWDAIKAAARDEIKATVKAGASSRRVAG